MSPTCLTDISPIMNNASSSSDNSDEILHVHYDYTSTCKDELTLKRGSKLEVLSKDQRVSGSEGWWTGRIVDTESVGIFPANFVASSQPNLSVIEYKDLQIGELIGVGGFGHVHYGKFGDVDVAVKTAKSLSSFSTVQTPNTHRKNESDDQSSAVQKTLVESLLREARLFSNLKHQNIIQLFGVSPSIATRNLYLVMEYAHGGALSQLLQSRGCGLHPHVFIHYAKQIADGMKYLHDEAAEHIIHRDLKSSNVLILEKIEDVQDDVDLLKKTLKITDFGLAKKQMQSSSMSTAGTYPWMSPECISIGEYSVKSDVWSFGVVLWECLTGEIPYKGFNQMQVAFGIAMKSYSLPIPSTCPEEFAQLMRNCWQSLPSDRPSFNELFDEINAIIERNYSEASLSKENTYHSLHDNWREEIQTMFEDLKNMEQEIRDREQQMVRQTIEQNHQQMQLEKREQQLHEYEMQLMERELRLLMLKNNQERAQHKTPKVHKRSGRFVRSLVQAAFNGHRSLSPASARHLISDPINFRHLFSVSRDQVTHLTSPGSDQPASTPGTPNPVRLRTLTSDGDSPSCVTVKAVDDVHHLADQSERSPPSPSSKSNRSSSLDQSKRSRKGPHWPRSKPGVRPTSSKRKKGKNHGPQTESKWYIQPTSNPPPDPETASSISSAKSTPTLDRPKKPLVADSFDDLSSSSSSISSIAPDRSLTRGLLAINSMLTTVGLGRAVPSMKTAESSETTRRRFFHSTSEKVARPKLSTSSSSTSSPPPKKQHKRTCSSPTANILATSNEPSPQSHRARPSYSPIRPNSLVLTSIPPPPASRSPHISQSDSQLNTRHHQPTRMSSTPEEDEHISDTEQHHHHYQNFFSPHSPIGTTSNLSKSEQQLHVSHLLDIETDEQKTHQTKVLPPEIDRKKFFVSLEALERDFLD